MPLPEELGIEYATYLNGLAETVGELRRRCLDILRHGYSDEAERLLGCMDEIYSLLVTMDYPDAITNGLRRQTDLVRGIVERTRGDLTTQPCASTSCRICSARRSRSSPNWITMRAVRASEIGSYLFCARAWWYRLQGVESQNQGELAAGTSYHQRHGRSVAASGLLRVLAWLLLMAALVFLAIGLTSLVGN